MEYTYDLQEEPTPLPESLPAVVSMVTKIKDLPVYNVQVALKSYRIEKETNLNLKRELYKTLKPISFMKVSCEYYRMNHLREITVLNTIYSLGIDSNIWKFTFETTMISTCYSNDFDFDLISGCNEYTKKMIDLSSMNQMLRIPIELAPLESMDQLHSRSFDGYVKTFGDESTFQHYGLDDLYPKNQNDARSIQNAVHTSSLQDYLKENAMVVDVIRKSNGKRG